MTRLMKLLMQVKASFWNLMVRGSAIGSFAGAWVKVHNGIPVLAQITPTGDHEDISASINEVINQSQVFHFGQTDETPTENEGVKTTEVSVSVIPGAVVVKGAEGKTVAISNVLGPNHC